MFELNFHDRVAWVTGGTSGIGRAIVRAFSDAGAAVAYNYTRDNENARSQREWFEEQARPYLASRFDVTDEAAIHAFVEEIQNRWHRLDILVCNAGIRYDAVSWKLSTEDWKRVIEINLTGTFLCTRSVIPIMRSAGYGRIIFISSINGSRGKFGQSCYTASKAGMIGLMRTLARELGSFGITVNTVSPGMVMTPMTETLPENIIEQARNEAVLPSLPDTDDITAAVLYLASNFARCVTGEILRVDSGQYLG